MCTAGIAACRSSSLQRRAARIAVGDAPPLPRRHVLINTLLYAWHNTIEQSRTEVLQADALATAIGTRVGGQREDVETTIILFADPALTKLAGNLPAWPREVSASTGVRAASIEVRDRVVRAVLLHEVLPGGYHLLLGRDVSRFEKLEALFMSGLMGAACMLLLLGVAGRLLVHRPLLSKVHDINQAAAAIMQGNLAQRLPAYGGESELKTLVETENQMLDQIEHSVVGIRNVSNAIAHDLRTPLAELRARLEELSVPRPRPEHRCTLPAPYNDLFPRRCPAPLDPR